MVRTQTENQSQLCKALWAICPVCKKERRVKESGLEMVQHRYYDEAAKEMWYCDGSHGPVGNVTIRSGDREDKGKARGKYNVGS